MARLDDASFGASLHAVVHAVLQAASRKSRKSRKNHATCLFVFTRTKARRMHLSLCGSHFLFRITQEHVLHLLLNRLQGIQGGLRTPVTPLL